VPGTALTSVDGQTAWKGVGQGATARKGATRIAGTASQAGSLGAQGVVPMPGVIAVFGTVPGRTGADSGGTGPAASQGMSRAHSGSPAQRASLPKQASQSRLASQPRAAKRPGNAGQNGATPRGGMAPWDGAKAANGQRAGTAAIPGLEVPSASTSGGWSSPAAPSYIRHSPPAASTHVSGTAAQRAFISQVAPGAIAMQSRYGIPAAVTIAQAIDESGWGQSALAIRDHNLFGIKGTGPAGSDMLPTQEYQNGQYVSVTAAFRVYHNVAESIADHGELLATSPYYQRAMADRSSPDAFANDLTGVYATDPRYGANLIAIMRLYNLYRYNMSPPARCPAAIHAETGPSTVPGKDAHPKPHPTGHGQKRTPNNIQPPPQPSQPAGQGWEQFALTMFGIPIVVDLFSSAVYERLRKGMRHEHSSKFKFHIIRDDGSIIDASLETDDSEAVRQVVWAFRQLTGPGKLYKWHDGTQGWQELSS